MHRTALSIVCIIALTGGALVFAEPRSEQDPSIWMKKKLIHSQEILRGLVTEDFELIRARTAAMKRLNRLEYFVRREPEAYRTQLKAFLTSLEGLERQAVEKNLGGATQAFTQMTQSCIKCHQHLRENKDVP